VHKNEIKRVREDPDLKGVQLETIVHPNEYFARSYRLKSLGKTGGGKGLREGGRGVEEASGSSSSDLTKVATAS